MSCSNIRFGICKDFCGLCDTSNFQPRYALRRNYLIPSVIFIKYSSLTTHGGASLLTLATPDFTEAGMLILQETDFIWASPFPGAILAIPAALHHRQNQVKHKAKTTQQNNAHSLHLISTQRRGLYSSQTKKPFTFWPREIFHQQPLCSLISQVFVNNPRLHNAPIAT
jgi:hypothetical protein